MTRNDAIYRLTSAMRETFLDLGAPLNDTDLTELLTSVALCVRDMSAALTADVHAVEDLARPSL